jgi:RNA polymerase sigma-70 factor (ECF subfamily)
MATQRLDQTEAMRISNGEQERSLAIAVQRGDSGAFRELYDAFRERIWTLVVYSIGDSLQAQDVLQTVFFKAFRGLRSFRFQSSLFTWIYRIARNECRNYQRRRNAPHVPLEAIIGSSDEIDPRLISDGNEARKAILQNAVMQLPLKMREVVVLKYLEGLSYKEMSRVLGCAPGTVASRLNRALAELEEQLRPFRRLL